MNGAGGPTIEPQSAIRNPFLSLFLFLLPLNYLGLVLILQPADRLAGDVRLLFDDFDMAAMALRGLNAQLGRLPGRSEQAPIIDQWEFARAMDSRTARQPRYFLEYPHAALLLFRLGFVLQPRIDGDTMPAAVLDAAYHNLVFFTPRTPGEQQLWRRFRLAMQFYNVVMIGCLLGLIAILRTDYEPDMPGAAALVLLVLPAAMYFALNRFDVIPALLTAGSLACLGRRWILLAALLLGVATMVKVYPLLLAPLMLRYLLPQWRNALLWTAAYGLTVLVFLFLPLLLWDWDAVWAPYFFQLARPPEMGLTGYGYVFPMTWAESKSFRLGSLVVAEGVLVATWPTSLTSLLRRGMLILLVFVAVPVFYSPQWVLWLLPLLVPLARRSWWIFGLAVALDLVTYATFPVLFDLEDGTFREVGRLVLIYGRYLILVLLAGMIGWAELRETVRQWRPWPAPLAV